MLRRAEKFLVKSPAAAVNFLAMAANFPGLLRLPELPRVTVKVSRSALQS